MKRIFDLVLCLVALALLWLPMLLTTIAVLLTSRGPILFWSNRVGRNNTLFKMPKFRTMKTETPEVATHLLKNPQEYLTGIGSFLRKTSLDELPQLWSILVGDMSFVGPRPALFNQRDLVDLRANKGVNILLPGLTGWAQINGRDTLTISQKAALDSFYLKHISFCFDIYILWITFLRVAIRRDISH